MTPFEIAAAVCLKGALFTGFSMLRSRKEARTKARAEHAADALGFIDLFPNADRKVWTVRQKFD